MTEQYAYKKGGILLTSTAKTYTDPTAFLARIQPYLERREALNNLPLGIAGRLVEAEPSAPLPFMATVNREDDAIALVALMTPPHSLIVYSEDSKPSRALDALATDLLGSSWRVPGVIGLVDTAKNFAQVWQRHTGIQHRTRMNLRVYQLTKVKSHGAASGQLQAARAENLELLSEWCSAFTIEVGDAEHVERDERRRHVQDHIRRGTLFVWQDGGRPVAMAARTRPTAHGEVINDVYTPPELRGRGYATACVAALSQLLLDEGRDFCALFTDLTNPTSNSIYQKIGYRALGDFVHCQFS